MSEISSFESRTGNLDCDAEGVYNFITDIRNFERFIPKDKVTSLKIDEDSCSFQMSMLGTVNVRIIEKIKPGRVLFSGTALQVNNFSLLLNILSTGTDHSEVKIILSGEMNPFLKMIAADPVKQFLETLIKEMEKFRDWKNIK
jgi:hypothetical protein